jgi:hypothetical protein
LENHQEVEQGNVQTKSTSEKNMVIDDNAPLKMIMPKNPEVRVSNVNERKTQSAPRSKPTVKNLLDKYTSRKFKNVFNRLGGSKRRRSPTRPGGHVRWREKSYNQQYYFPMVRTYWSCSPPTYPQFPPRGYIPWAPYLTNSESYCQAEFIRRRPIFRPHFHEKKARFTHEARSHAAIVIRGSRSQEYNVGGKKYIGDRKLAWVPVRSAGTKSSSTIVSQPPTSSNGTDVDHCVKPGETKVSDISGSVQQHGSGRVEKDGILELNGKGSNSHAESSFTHDGSMHGCTNSITAKSTGLHADLMPNVDTHSEKHVVRRSAGEREPTDASTDISVNGNRRFEASGKQQKCREFASGNFGVDRIGCGSVQGKGAGRERKHANYTLVASSSTSTSQMSESANTLAVSALRSNSSGTSQPMVFRYSASTPAQRWNSRSGGNRRVAASDVFDQQRLFLAKEKMFAPQASVSQYRPRNSRRNRIISVAPGTKPGTRWCPAEKTT